MERQLVFNVCVALGIGLLIGAERERSNDFGVEQDAAGVRTFSVAALLGATALIVLPLAPNVGTGPFNAINPHKIAQFVLMVRA